MVDASPIATSYRQPGYQQIDLQIVQLAILPTPKYEQLQNLKQMVFVPQFQLQAIAYSNILALTHDGMTRRVL